jgi:hypothetical protein
MGCFSSKPDVSPPPPPSLPAPAPEHEGHSHKRNPDASQAPAVSSSRPNAAIPAHPPPSNRSRGDTAPHDVQQTARLLSPVPPPFIADAPPLSHKSDATPAPKPPKRTMPVPSSPHNRGALVSSSSQGAAGTTTILVQPNMGPHNSRPYEHNNRMRPAPSSYHPAPIDRSISAQPQSQSRLPPRAVPASSPFHNDGMSLSSPSQRVEGMSVSPPAQLDVETSQSRPYEHGRPSSYRSTSISRSRSAQPLSHWGPPAPSSPPVAGTMLASRLPPDLQSENLPRKSTLETKEVYIAKDDGHRRFPPMVRTVLSNNLRYAPKRCLITYN